MAQRNTGARGSWRAMHCRCKYPSSKSFRDYGARGIKICERWDQFENFLADMGERPPGKTLGRKNNDGNYEPGNCKWETKSEQERNTRRNRVYVHNGQAKCMAEWAEEYNIPRSVLDGRLKTGWSFDRAITCPVRPRVYEGESLTELSKRTNISYSLLWQRINTLGWSIDKAISCPKYHSFVYP